jgi:DNA-binding NarL/FixJ family response regulator
VSTYTPTTLKAMSPRPNLVNACRPSIERLQRLPAAKRLDMARELTAQIQEVQSLIATHRRSAVRELRADGWTLNRIAQTAGVTVSRIKQIEEGSARQSASDAP